MTVNGDPQSYLGLRVTVGVGAKERTLELLVDTACSGTCVRPSVANQMGLKELAGMGTQQGIGAGGVTNFNVRVCPNLRFGGRSHCDLPVVLQDLGPLPANFDGILGLDVLQKVT